MSGSNSTSMATSLLAATSTTSAPSSATTTSSPDSSSSIANSSPTIVSTSDSSTTPSSSSIFSSSSSSIFSSSESSTSTTPPSSSETPTSTPPTSTTPPPTTPPSSTQAVVTSFVVSSPGGSTITQLVTSTEPPAPISSTTSSSTSSSSSAGSTAGLQTPGKATSSHGLGTGGTIAVAVVVPIVAVALLVLAGLFLWRKRKARKDAEELRRKEVEEYGYNPNNDPTLPTAGAAGGQDGPFEMREDGSSGYRGWGTTAVASSGRKASTTLSGGQSAGGVGMAYSEGTSPTRGAVSDTRSDNPLVDGRPTSSEPEVLGAMGPAASANRGGDINRGPSNASSSYSAANRSDGSGEAAPGGAYYNNQYDTGNPYSETAYGSPPGRAEMSGQPVIRDVQARRNTRIENPSHFPQQSAGISQNF